MYMISVLPLSKATLRRASFITVTKFETPFILSEGEVIILRSSHEIEGQVMIYLRVVLELFLVAKKKCL